MGYPVSCVPYLFGHAIHMLPKYFFQTLHCMDVHDQTYIHIMSFYREKTLYIDVAVFGKKCYTNARRTSKVQQQRLLH